MRVDRRRFFASLVGLPVAGAVAGAAAAAPRYPTKPVQYLRPRPGVLRRLPPGSINVNQIADGCVTREKIAAGTVTVSVGGRSMQIPYYAS